MDNDEIRLSDIVYTIVKNRMMILAVTFLGLVIGVVISLISYARGEISKEYAITTSIAVTSVTEDGLFTTKSSNPGSTDIYLAENMVDSVIYVMKSDKLLTKAVDKMGLIGVPVSDISKNLEMKQYNDTQIIEVTLLWRSAEEGVQILSAINAVAPSVLIETLKIGGVSVVNAPTANYRVGGKINLALCGQMTLLGLAVSLAICILKALIWPTLLNSRDVENVLEEPLLGEVPEDPLSFSQKKIIPGADDVPGAVAGEYLATIAHILRNRIDQNGHKILYVTSAAENEGKTSVAAHLAVHLAELERKVLLIDFDVRNPSLGALFLNKVEYLHSLNALYRGDSTLEEVITHLSGNLDLLPSILERRELPLDDAMLKMVRQIAENYDVVLMDTAPVGRVADALNLNAITGSMLYVARYDAVPLSTMKMALERLKNSGVRVVGCIVNGVPRGLLSVYNRNYYAGKQYRVDRKTAPKEPLQIPDHE